MRRRFDLLRRIRIGVLADTQLLHLPGDLQVRVHRLQALLILPQRAPRQLQIQAIQLRVIHRPTHQLRLQVVATPSMHIAQRAAVTIRTPAKVAPPVERPHLARAANG